MRAAGSSSCVINSAKEGVPESSRLSPLTKIRKVNLNIGPMGPIGPILRLTLRIFVNGESREFSGTPSLAELITRLELPAARIAVELNREVVRHNDWSGTMLHENDRVELVHFVGGGAD